MSLGLETPMILPERPEDERLKLLEEHFEGIMRVLGLDLMDDSLHDSPRRLAKMYLNENIFQEALELSKLNLPSNTGLKEAREIK